MDAPVPPSLMDAPVPSPARPGGARPGGAAAGAPSGGAPAAPAQPPPMVFPPSMLPTTPVAAAAPAFVPMTTTASDADSLFAQAEAEAEEEGRRRSSVAGSGSKRPAAPALTPSRLPQQRYTPSKLLKADGIECVHSGSHKRKVQFKFEAQQPAFEDLEDDNADAPDEARDSLAPFPSFSLAGLPGEKENAPNSARSSDGGAEPPASLLRKSMGGATAAAAPGSGGGVSFEPRLASTNLSLGGASRVLVSGKPKRTLQHRQTLGGTVGGAIAKARGANAGGGSVQRRVSVAAQQAIDNASRRRQACGE